MSRVLRIGPTGLLRVWVAINAATINPVQAPSAARTRSARIHLNRLATNALKGSAEQAAEDTTTH